MLRVSPAFAQRFAFALLSAVRSVIACSLWEGGAEKKRAVKSSVRQRKKPSFFTHRNPSGVAGANLDNSYDVVADDGGRHIGVRGAAGVVRRNTDVVVAGCRDRCLSHRRGILESETAARCRTRDRPQTHVARRRARDRDRVESSRGDTGRDFSKRQRGSATRRPRLTYRR